MSTTPRRLGDRYELGEVLGRGGMADVLRARDLLLDRDVAVKLLRDVGDVDRQRFASEARLLAMLNHPCVVTVLDTGVEDDRPWLVLELVEGRPLSDLMTGVPFAPARLAALAAQVATGLAHAHAQGIAHRDVKPANVMITADGRAKLTDFGIARLLGTASGLTQTGHAIGTAAYLAPEQVAGEPVTTASDVYALGLLLLEAHTGRREYDGPPFEAALARLSRAPVVPTSLPPGWSTLIASMTVREASERPGAAAVAARLDALATEPLDTGRPVPDGRTRVLPLTSGAPTVQSRRRRAPLLLAAAMVVVLLGVALAVVRGGGDDDAAAAGTTRTTTQSDSSGAATPTSTPTPTSTRGAEPAPAPRTDPPATSDPGTSAGPPGPGKTGKKGKGDGKGQGKSKDKSKDKSKSKGKG